MKKRFLSLVLCICMVLSICPALNLLPTIEVQAATSQVHNFTDDGWTSTFYTFTGDQITNGKHGTYTHDFGSGKETLNYALKLNGDGAVTFTPTADGTVTIAVASTSSSAKVAITDASANEVGTLSVSGASTLTVLTVDVKADTTYSVKRTNKESGLYYIAYEPTNAGGTTCDVCSYGEVTYAWAGDYATCTASHTCSVCGNVETVDSISVASETTATCANAGETTYTATFADSVTWADTTESDPVATSATGNHNYVDGVCSVCGAAQPTTEEKTHTFTPSKDVTAGADKDAIAAGTTYADGFFTVVGTVTQRVSSGKVTTIEVGKNGSGSIQFTVTGTSVVTVQFSSTGGSNKSTVGIVDEAGNLMTNAEGITEVSGTGATTVTYTLPAGTYSIVSPESDYNRGARVHSVNVVENAVINTCEHTNQTTTTVDASCGVAGSVTVTCDACHAIISKEEIPATGNHTYDKENPTGKCTVCTQDCGHSYTGGVCTICGMAQPVCSHEWDEGVVTTAPTCNTEGVLTKTCTKGCGATTTEAIPVDDSVHVIGEVTKRVSPTCIREGWETGICELCHEEVTVTLPAAHDYSGVDGKCVCTGGALEYCGAVNDNKYVHNFTEPGGANPLVDPDGFFTIAGAMKDNSKSSVVYNGKILTEYIKMNKKNGFTISFKTLPTAGDVIGDGILILVTESRTSSSGTATLTTLIINGVEVGVPRDGILVLGVSADTTYTITKEDGENPLFYIEYVPGARLIETDDDATEDDIITMTAEIIDAEGRLISQHPTLADALAKVQAGQSVCLLENSSENVTVGGNLNVGESFTIHMHAVFSGTINADEGVTVTGPTNGEYTVTRNAAACEHEANEPVKENVVEATCHSAGSYDSVVYCSKCNAELSRETITVPATGEHVDENGDGVCDTDGCDAEVSNYVAQNVQTEKKYTTVSAALEEAENGQTVILLKNVDETGVFLTVRNGVTLDLNGYTLTAAGLSAFNGNNVIDDSETTTGLLVVPYSNLILPQDNQELPVWNESNGYFFVSPKTITGEQYYQHFDTTYTEGLFKIKFKPGFGYINGTSSDGTNVRTTYFNNGGADNGITMSIQVSWEGANGPICESFVFTDEMFISAYAAGKGFTLTMTSMGSVQEVAINVVIVSDTGVEYVGEAMTWVANAEPESEENA